MKELDNYYKACEELTKRFCKVAGLDYDEGYFVADDPSGVFAIWDCFYNLQTITQFLESKASRDDLDKWYDTHLEATMQNIPFPKLDVWFKMGKPSLKTWIKNR